MPSSAEHGFERLGLADRARKAVEQHAAARVGLFEAFFHELIDDVVRDEVAGLEDRGDLLAEFAAGLHALRKMSPSRRADGVLLAEHGGLCPLTRALFPRTIRLRRDRHGYRFKKPS